MDNVAIDHTQARITQLRVIRVLGFAAVLFLTIVAFTHHPVEYEQWASCVEAVLGLEPYNQRLQYLLSGPE